MPRTNTNKNVFLRHQKEIIDRVGWAVMNIFPGVDDPDTVSPFAYTVGLAAHGYPELLITGLPPDLGHALLNKLAVRVYDKAERFTHGQRVSDLLTGHDVVIVEGPATEELLPRVAIALYGRDQVRLQQVVWPDLQDRFPWEDGYELDRHEQPLIAHP